MTVVVSASDLQLGYRRKIVTDGLNLDITLGITAILGPNGAGKSTLLQAIATAKKVRRGSLEILGASIADRAGLAAARRSTSFLPQTPGYQRGFTVVQHLRYCCWLKTVPASHETLTATLESMDLGSIANRRLRTLSGGQLRRTMLAGAMVTSPALLILDEPSVGLDPKQRRQFKSNLTAVSQKASVIFSTHLLDEVVGIADHVVVLQSGEVRFHGTPAELTSGSEANDDGTDSYMKLVE